MSDSSPNSKVDYAGRTVDLLLLKTILDVPVAMKRMGIDVSNVSGEPMIVSGVEKMVQRFALTFITAMGSVKFRPDHGTRITPDVAQGRIYNMSSLRASAAEANMLARVQIRTDDEAMAEAGEDTPDDERLVDSEVVDLEFSREKAKAMVSIRLTSAAGSSYTYIIPVAIGVH